MLKYLTRPDALARVNAQHAGQEVHGLRVDLAVHWLLEVEAHPSVVLVHLLEPPPFKQRLFCEQDVQNGTCREDVANWIYFLSLDECGDFWRDVTRCSAPVKEIVFAVDVCCKSKVNNDRIQASFSSEHDIFRFDIAMHYAIIMNFLESLCHSYHKLPDLRKREVALPAVDSTVQLACADQLQYHVQGVITLKNAFQLDQMRRIYCSHYFYLVQKRESLILVGRVESGLLGEGLNGKVQLICQPFHLIDSRKASLSQLFDWLIQAMEAKLVEASIEVFNPDVNPILRKDGKLNRRRGSFVQSEAHSFGEDGRFTSFDPIGFISDLELQLIGERGKVLIVVSGLIIL